MKITNLIGPQTLVSQQIHAEKHREPGESFEAAMNRVNTALGGNQDSLDMLVEQRFLPGGRVQRAVGSRHHVTAHNCYVSGTIEDSFVEGNGCIMQRAHEAAATLRMGGGIGFDFSTLRPLNAPVKRLGSTSSGSVSFMKIFDAVAKNVKSAGHRRAALMGVLRCDHPDIFDFVKAKRCDGELNEFNISVACTDAFMQAVIEDGLFDLTFGGQVYSRIRARDLWEPLMQSTWDWADPGVLFIDRINEMNNLYYCEKIAATNPCGEQPLPPFGACLLGSINLVKYVRVQADLQHFDWHAFHDDVALATRLLDKVIDVGRYPLPQQEREAKAKRRMGIGYTGLANALEILGHQYGSPKFLKMQEAITRALTRCAYLESVEMAKENGPFPLFDVERYMQGKFIKSLDPDVQDQIRRYGIRNSHLTSIAPAGTISYEADYVSSGIEPPWSYEGARQTWSEGKKTEIPYSDYAYREFGVRGLRADDISVQDHLKVLCAAQKYIDSAVSKTCNVGSDVPREHFDQVYIEAWRNGAKGCTTYRKGGLRAGILTSTDSQEEGACQIDPVTGAKTCG